MFPDKEPTELMFEEAPPSEIPDYGMTSLMTWLINSSLDK